MQGDLETYRFCDNVWTFILKSVKFDISGPGGDKSAISVDRLKLLLVTGRLFWVDD